MTLKTQTPPRKRVKLSTPEESITDQTLVNEFSMSSIKSKLEKHLPINNLTNNTFYSLKPLQYTNLQDALNFHESVQKQFESLPVQIRKEMGHDLRNFESYIADPKNSDTLQKYGLLTQPDASNSDIVKSVNELKDHFKSSNTSPDAQKPTK